MIETIKAISTLIGAITVIIGALIAIEKWTKGKVSNWILKPVFDRFDKIEHAVNKNDERLCKVELDSLRLVIMCNNMPIEERLMAGERYVSLGGNGAIKVHLKVLREEYENQIDKK